MPPAVERHFNPTPPAAPAVSARGRALHARLLVVDLHADSLLWGRDLLERGARGHVDLPRMAEGNLAVQGFTVVTHTPRVAGEPSSPPSSTRPDQRTLSVMKRPPGRRWAWARSTTGG